MQALTQQHSTGRPASKCCSAQAVQLQPKRQHVHIVHIMRLICNLRPEAALVTTLEWPMHGCQRGPRMCNPSASMHANSMASLAAHAEVSLCLGGKAGGEAKRWTLQHLQHRLAHLHSALPALACLPAETAHVRTLRFARARVAKRVVKERSEYKSATREAWPQCLSSVGTTSSISFGMPSERSLCSRALVAAAPFCSYLSAKRAVRRSLQTGAWSGKMRGLPLGFQHFGPLSKSLWTWRTDAMQPWGSSALRSAGRGWPVF